MPFEKGKVANPNGRPKGEKIFSEMLRIAVKEAHGQGGNRLRAVADRLVEEALDGNVQAIKEIRDTLDGKPAQTQIHTGDEQGGPMRHQMIERQIIDPKGSDDTT